MADEPDAEYLGETDDEGGPVKSFLGHLEDLRWVLIKSAAALSVAMLICLISGNYVVQLIKWPLTQARIHHVGTNQIATVLVGTNQVGVFHLSPAEEEAFRLGTNRYVAVQIEPITIGTNQVLSWKLNPDSALAEKSQRLHIELINLSPAGGFVVAFQVAFYGGLVMSAPFILYFVAIFVFPALKLREKKYVYRGLFFAGGLFFVGVVFCYFVLLPLTLSASQMYSEWLGFGAYQWKAEDYISFVCKFMLGMGLGFELPVVILTLVKIGVLNHAILSKARRYMIVINLLLGAILTSPEVFTQVAMFFPLQFLYELSVRVAWYWEHPNPAKARRQLLVGLLVGLIILGVLIWLGYKYGLPWLHQHGY